MAAMLQATKAWYTRRGRRSDHNVWMTHAWVKTDVTWKYGKVNGKLLDVCFERFADNSILVTWFEKQESTPIGFCVLKEYITPSGKIAARPTRRAYNPYHYLSLVTYSEFRKDVPTTLASVEKEEEE